MSLSVFDKHQIAIAKRTLQLSDEGALILGGMTKEEARAILQKHKIRVNGASLTPANPGL